VLARTRTYPRQYPAMKIERDRVATSWDMWKCSINWGIIPDAKLGVSMRMRRLGAENGGEGAYEPN
jgi:hypothetical protein